MRTLAALGPPGTGKTTFGLELVTDWKRRLAPQEIGYLAFTRAAAYEAMERVGGDKESHPWFRTIHSLCYRLQRDVGNAQVMTGAHYKRFAEETGMEGTYAVESHDDLAEVYLKLQGGGKTVWDRCRTAFTLSRLMARTPDDLDAARHRVAPEALTRIGFLYKDQYGAFVKAYDAFRKKNGLVDFTDMLEWALRHGVGPPLRRVIVDEAQDLCPLHFAILWRLFHNVEELWMIGDDDQSIYKFSGASAEEFLSHIRPHPKVILRQTHRFGKGIVDFSARIISRVSERIQKDIIGLNGKTGAVISSHEFKPAPGRYLILHRHVDGCRDVAASFMEAGIPFSNERGKDPLSSGNRIKAYLALVALSAGEQVTIGRLQTLLGEEIPSTFITPAPEEQKIRYMPHGAKKKLEEIVGNIPVNIDELVKRKLLTENGAMVVREKDFASLKHEADLRFYDKVERNGYPLSKKNAPIITTIHGSKGRQAPHVVVFTETSRRCWEDSDSEHRLAYVAATRTQGDVTICEERRVDWASAPYLYPLEA